MIINSVNIEPQLCRKLSDIAHKFSMHFSPFVWEPLFHAVPSSGYRGIRGSQGRYSSLFLRPRRVLSTYAHSPRRRNKFDHYCQETITTTCSYDGSYEAHYRVSICSEI